MWARIDYSGLYVLLEYNVRACRRVLMKWDRASLLPFRLVKNILVSQLDEVCILIICHWIPDVIFRNSMGGCNLVPQFEGGGILIT